MSTTQQSTHDTARVPTPQEHGIGARVSIHPHSDDFVEVIVGALDDVERAGLTDGLTLETDEVSTYVGALETPAEERLARYLTAVIAAATHRSNGGHVVAHILLSRGCPCVRSCDVTTAELPSAPPVDVETTGIPAVAHWALYPLLEGTSDGADHMPLIKAAIEAAQRRGTATSATHYATRLSGDVAEVLATAVSAWALVGTEIPHVVSHLTVSVGSPSAGTTR